MKHRVTIDPATYSDKDLMAIWMNAIRQRRWSLFPAVRRELIRRGMVARTGEGAHTKYRLTDNGNACVKEHNL